MNERLKKQLDFIIEIDKMKSIYRQTLVIDKSKRENDAEHSWHIALMAVILYEYAYTPKVDINRVIKMVLVHDLVEIYAGDTFAYDEIGYADKEQRETEAADKLFSILPAEQGMELRELWQEFDKMETPDAIYASSIDRLQPFLINYKTDGHTWRLRNVVESKVYKRMEAVKTGLPELWDFIVFAINDSVEKGYIVRD